MIFPLFFGSGTCMQPNSSNSSSIFNTVPWETLASFVTFEMFGCTAHVATWTFQCTNAISSFLSNERESPFMCVPPWSLMDTFELASKRVKSSAAMMRSCCPFMKWIFWCGVILDGTFGDAHKIPHADVSGIISPVSFVMDSSISIFFTIVASVVSSFIISLTLQN